MSTEKHTCEKQIYPGSGWGRGHSCGRTATLEHNGGWYCKTHHPPTVNAKFESRYKENNAKITKRIEGENQMRADHARMEALAKGEWYRSLCEVAELVAHAGGLRAAIDQWMKKRTA